MLRWTLATGRAAVRGEAPQAAPVPGSDAGARAASATRPPPEPARDPTATSPHRLTQLDEQRRRVTPTTSPALYLHEYTAGGLTVRGLVGALDMSRRADTLAEPRGVAARGRSIPSRPASWPTGCCRWTSTPHRSCWCTTAPASSATSSTRCAHAEPDWRYLDRTGQRHRIWAIRDAGPLARSRRRSPAAACLIADGHHRYAAYLRLQEEHPGTAWDRGLAMLVDQDDTPLFLGAIHRTLPGPTLDDARRRGRAAGAERDRARPPARRSAPSTARTSSLTDGEPWHAVAARPRPGGPPWRGCTSTSSPGCPRPPRRIELPPHRRGRPAATGRAGARGAAAQPRLRPGAGAGRPGGLLPEKATSFQPKPSLGVAHAPAARRMTRGRATSTSTRDRVAPPAWKNRRRTAPVTSTRSPARHVGTTAGAARRSRPRTASESTR